MFSEEVTNADWRVRFHRREKGNMRRHLSIVVKLRDRRPAKVSKVLPSDLPENPTFEHVILQTHYERLESDVPSEYDHIYYIRKRSKVIAKGLLNYIGLEVENVDQ